MSEASIQFEIEIDGLSQFREMVQGRIANAERLRPFFEAVATDFYDFERKVFAAGGAHEGLPGWQALCEKYARWKAKRYRGARILVQSGRLRDALTTPDAADSIYEIGDEQLHLGASRRTPDGKWDLGLLHQRGTSRMPARPPLRLSAARAKRWIRLFADHLHGEA